MRFVILAALIACSSPPPPPAPPETYHHETAWLCLPGHDDVCAHDLTTTAIGADGSRLIQKPEVKQDVDCFYVYPTVDLRLGAGNTTDFKDLSKIEHATLSQAVRFGQLCKMYVPLYRQATIGSYLHRDSLEQHLAAAYADVSQAFRTYLSTMNRGRPIVLIGHSQGAEMTIRLLKEYFDHDPELRKRLVIALPIGGHVEVTQGKTTGGTFTNVPICASEDDRGCVIAYRSYREGGDIAKPDPALPPSDAEVCTSPGDTLDATFLATEKLHGTEGVTTPYVTFPGLYSARCVDGPNGARALAIRETRPGPIDLDRWKLNTKLGTHILDFQISQENLIRRVARAAK
ncbi:MAG: DUF3089 domain-containing protein [Kofleriaceae bacterium]